ncbi:MAG: hypothetical protein LCH92_08185 [Proteobacteria bacterium]|nr:hypothetical protein [Pseudomonadota bacterium]
MTAEQVARVEAIKDALRGARSVAEVNEAVRVHAAEVAEMAGCPVMGVMAIQIKNLAAWKRRAIWAEEGRRPHS